MRRRDENGGMREEGGRPRRVIEKNGEPNDIMVYFT